jgi:hypothetical protein
MRLSGMVNQLTMLGDLEPADKVMLKFLHISRPWFQQLVISIETLLDVSTLSLEEVTGRLRSAEEDGVAPHIADGKLYLTEQVWVEHSRKKETDGGQGGSGSDDGRGRGGGGHGSGRGHGGHGDGANSSGGKGNCHRCRKPRHWARGYWSKQPKKKKEEQAFTAQEEETSLLFADIESTNSSTPHQSDDYGWISGKDGEPCKGGRRGMCAGG